MLHPKLQPFAQTAFIDRMNAVLKRVAKELETAGSSELEVEVVSNRDASLLHQLFTFQLKYEANQWLSITGDACGYLFRLILPFRNGVTLPYELEICLKAKASIYAELGGWITSRGIWFTKPPNHAKAKALRRLRLPGVGWVHAAGAVKHTLQDGGFILPPGDGAETNRWIVRSAYQGFIFVRPRVVKYLRAAERLDTLLATMS